MRLRPASIRVRLLLGAAAVLVAFVAFAGAALQRAHADSVRAAHFARLQGTVYILLAATEFDGDGKLAMPASLAEPRLSLPMSGLYASIVDSRTGQQWRSASTAGVVPPFAHDAVVGQWRQAIVTGPVPPAGGTGRYLAVTYGVQWNGPMAQTSLVLSVLEDTAAFERELGVFQRTLWGWLGGAGILLLLSQTLLLGWGLRPLARMSREIAAVEAGGQSAIEGRYPSEIAALTDNLNALIRRERVRQQRYQEALSYLAHSLKTPLAVLRSVLREDPQRLREAIAEQVGRMDDIVAHQLARARASGAARFGPKVALEPVLTRVRESLLKVYADKCLAIEVECAVADWRIDEGDLFEIAGNLMDNAAKWARARVRVRAWRSDAALHLRVEDDGPGFSDTRSVLALHVRGDERVPGHGVGLAVVNELVASHEGRLELGRSELGGGLVELVLPPA